MSVVTHMDRGFDSYSKPSYADVDASCRHISEFIHYSQSSIGKVEVIVGITRGGLMPGVILSNLLNVPMKTVQYSSKHGAGDNKNHENILPEMDENSILLVDDICDSGRTLHEVSKVYQNRGHLVHSAVIYFKDLKEKTLHRPDVWAVKISKNFGWVTFDWEK